MLINTHTTETSTLLTQQIQANSHAHTARTHIQYTHTYILAHAHTQHTTPEGNYRVARQSLNGPKFGCCQLLAILPSCYPTILPHCHPFNLPSYHYYPFILPNLPSSIHSTTQIFYNSSVPASWVFLHPIKLISYCTTAIPYAAYSPLPLSPGSQFQSSHHPHLDNTTLYPSTPGLSPCSSPHKPASLSPLPSYMFCPLHPLRVSLSFVCILSYFLSPCPCLIIFTSSLLRFRLHPSLLFPLSSKFIL